MNTVPKKTAFRLSKTDYAAFAVCAALFAFFVYRVCRGIGIADESFYYTIAQRLLQGDRLLIDDWHVSQLSALLLVLPYKLYTAIAGGTDGVLLFMRYVYIFCSFCIYWFLYARMRAHKVWGVAAAALFSAYICFIPTLSYLTMSIQGTAVFCALAFLGPEKKSVPCLLLAGVVLSCTVLAEPVFAAAYFLYCVLVLAHQICKKTGVADERVDFALNGRSWLFISLGVAACFAVFMLYLQVKCGVGAVFKIVPELFTDTEYDLGARAQRWLWPRKKYYEHGSTIYGGWPLRGLMWIIVLTYVLRLLERLSLRVSDAEAQTETKRCFARLLRPKIAAGAKAALLCAGCVFFVSAYVYALKALAAHNAPHDASVFTEMVLCQAMPPAAFGWICYNLCRDRDTRLFCFLAAAMLLSLLVDCASDMVCELGGPISLLCGVPHFGALLREIGESLPGEKKRIHRVVLRALQGIAALCAALFCVWTLVYLHQNTKGIVERFNLYDDAKPAAMQVKLEDGVYRGVRTTQIVQANYEDVMADMAAIKEKCSGAMYVTELAPAMYLTADLPYGTYSAWYVKADSETRLLRYWKLFPSRLPEYIYVPSVWFEDQMREETTDDRAAETIAFLETCCTFERSAGRAGEILHVLSWDTRKMDEALSAFELKRSTK